MAALLAIAGFLLVFWYLPWWAVGPVALAFGFVDGRKRGEVRWWRGLGLSGCAVLAALLVTYWRDRESGFLIARRVAGIFGFSGPVGVYFLMGLIAFLMAGVWYHAGRALVRARGLKAAPDRDLQSS